MKSPLRYPGGKSRACKILDTYIPHKECMLSPFFGGGSFELYRAGVWHANDLFEPVYTFWDSLKRDAHGLIQDIEHLHPMSKDQFYEIRRLSHINAAQFFAVNRCSFSGSTFCGGYSQQSASGRFTQSSIDRLRSVNLDTFTFSNMDGVDFLMMHPQTSDTWIYADPPYVIDTYIYGKNGDVHENFNHTRFAEYIKTRTDWTLCYNDCPLIRKLYTGCKIDTVSWSYGMNALKKSNEVIITPL